MLIDAPEIRDRLYGIVRRLAPRSWRDDLMQEALVHLWRAENQDPGRDEFWYLQGCRFHLQNCLRQGRSVDAPKRFQIEVCREEWAEDVDSNFEAAAPDAALCEEASLNDFVNVLAQWLTPRERETLSCLMDGLSARETATRLGFSHTMVNRHRSRIGELALRLGLGPSEDRAAPAP